MLYDSMLDADNLIARVGKKLQVYAVTTSQEGLLVRKVESENMLNIFIYKYS